MSSACADDHGHSCKNIWKPADVLTQQIQLLKHMYYVKPAQLYETTLNNTRTGITTCGSRAPWGSLEAYVQLPTLIDRTHFFRKQLSKRASSLKRTS